MSQDLRPLGDPGSEDFQVDAYPFYLLNRAVSRYNVVIEGALKPVGIDIPTWRVLMILGEKQPLAITPVAHAAVIHVSTLMRIVERMTRAGLIATSPSLADGRATELTLTAEGEARLRAARVATSPVYREVVKNIGAEEFSLLLDLLKRIHDSLADAPA